MEPWSLPNLPFFEDRHYAIARKAAAWREGAYGTDDLAERAKRIVRSLAKERLLDIVIPPVTGGGAAFDARALCACREALGFQNLLADGMFTMQGLGTAIISLHGTDDQRTRYLHPAREGETIAGLAISEADAGSDVAAISTTATKRTGGFILNGEKTWISNARFADHYIVLARTGEQAGSRGLSAFIVDAKAEGLSQSPIELFVEHPVGSLAFEDCFVPDSSLIGAPGQGFKLAMSTFDFFRPSVGAAAIGAAKRAFNEALIRVTGRSMYGRLMADTETVRLKLADMAVEIETSSLAVYQAAWMTDATDRRITKYSSISKLAATECAQRVVDTAVQIFGAAGIVEDSVVGKLYRDVRPMRIYEGASEVQKLVIGKEIVADWIAGYFGPKAQGSIPSP